MTNDATSAPPEDQLREQRLQRNLKIVVAVLGFLILAGLAAAIVKIVMLANEPKTGSGTVTATLQGPGGEIAVEVPKGARVVSVSLSGNRLAVHHEGPSGTGIAIVDIETGRRVVDVRPLEALPRQ